MMPSKISNKLFATSLLLLSLQTAANSEVCAEGACNADDSLFGQANELSFVQVSAMEKRAQEAASSGIKVENLDAAVQKKGKKTMLSYGSDKAKQPEKSNKVNTEAGSKRTVFSDKDNSTSKDSDKSNSTSKDSSKEKRKVEKRDPWVSKGDGCCYGQRDLKSGKLFGGRVKSLEACKQKCRSFNSCGMVEFGWKDDPEWCFAWSSVQTCQMKDLECTNSVIGNGKGAKIYEFTAPEVESEFKTSQWDIVGPGCCDGSRDESNGKLYAAKEPTLDACKAKCLSFENCGVIEYGWTTGDPEWCFIWDNSQKCEKQDLQCKRTLMGSGRGAAAHKLVKAEE